MKSIWVVVGFYGVVKMRVGGSPDVRPMPVYAASASPERATSVLPSLSVKKGISASVTRGFHVALVRVMVVLLFNHGSPLAALIQVCLF